MTKIQLGGIKILEGRSYAGWSCEKAKDALADVCSHMGSERINLSQVTHIADDGRGLCATSFCTEDAGSFTGYSFLKLDTGLAPRLTRDTTILSIFPHDRRPLVMGALVELLGREDMQPLGIASSPSAVSVVVPSKEVKATIEAIFSVFEFPAYGSPLKWETAYVGKEQLFRDVVGSYEEQEIKVYAVLSRPDLDFRALVLNQRELAHMGQALRQIDDPETGMDFLVADCNRPGEVVLGFCLPGSERRRVSRALDAHVPHAAHCLEEAAAIFFHGPHFGDRYRIASALTAGMQTAGIHPLALSCAVHSISVVLRAQDLSRGLQAVTAKFHVPADER